MNSIKFRPVRADEIDVRVQSINQYSTIVLLYKDARVDMDKLDETVGCCYWQKEYYECKGNLYCRVGINTENGLIWKVTAVLRAIRRQKRVRHQMHSKGLVSVGELVGLFTRHRKSESNVPTTTTIRLKMGRS